MDDREARRRELFPALLSRARKIGMTDDIYMLGLLVGYEMGDIQKALFYSRQRPEGELYLKTELAAALADLLMQVRVFIDSAGKSWDDLIDIGFERWEARIEDFEKSRGGLRPLR